MSGIVAISAAATITVAATAAAVAFPDAQALLLPLIDGNEYAVAAMSVLASLPTLALMSVLAVSSRR